MSAEEAKAYGLVDHVVESRKELRGANKPELMGETTGAALLAAQAANGGREESSTSAGVPAKTDE